MSSQVITKQTKYLAAFYLLAIIALAVTMPKKLDWSDSFSKDDAIPYGSDILFKEIDQIFSKPLSVVNETPYTFFKQSINENASANQEPSNYIIINRTFSPSQLDAEYLLDYVSEGNSLYISAIEYSESFLDTLGISQEYHLRNDFEAFVKLENDSFNLNFIHPDITDSAYYFKDPGLTKSLSIYSRDYEMTSLGYYGDDQTTTNFLKVKFGEGEIFIHSFPYAFTNYAMLNYHNSNYAALCLSNLKDRPTYWDEYYKFKKLNTSKNPLGILLSSIQLKWAWLLLLAGSLLFIIFNGKRKQRIIPIVKPLKNDSLEFVNTIGTLYYLKGEHANIVKKKINFFRAYLKTNYFINELKFDDELISQIAIKSGHPKDFIVNLFKMIKNIQSSEKVNGLQLVELTKKLNQFYKRN
jgi:hypothetical protein